MGMDIPFILGRKALNDASLLMADFGHGAVDEAAARAEKSRAVQNISNYCHWRQVERLVVSLSNHESAGTLH